MYIYMLLLLLLCLIRRTTYRACSLGQRALYTQGNRMWCPLLIPKYVYRKARPTCRGAIRKMPASVELLKRGRASHPSPNQP